MFLKGSVPPLKSTVLSSRRAVPKSRNVLVDHRLIGRDSHQGGAQQAQAIAHVRDGHAEGRQRDQVHQEDVDQNVVEVVVTWKKKKELGQRPETNKGLRKQTWKEWINNGSNWEDGDFIIRKDALLVSILAPVCFCALGFKLTWLLTFLRSPLWISLG